MKKFLLKIIFFIAPIIVSAIIIDIIISSNLRHTNINAGENEVWSDIYNGNIDADIAIYGSSRAWVHINPSIINDSLKLKAYNFGIDGHTFWLQYLRQKEYLKHNKKPKQIILSVDEFSLMKRKDLYNLNQFLPFMLFNENIRKYTSEYKGFKTADYYIPLARYSGKIINSIKSILNNEGEKYRMNGFRGMNRKWNNDLKNAKSEKTGVHIKVDEKTVALFEEFILECKKEKINITLVYTPEYKEGQTFVKNRKEIINLFSDFSNKYNLNFIDYSNDELCFEKKYFYNSLHLNKEGADLFTRKLCHDLKKNKL
jgi:hypothetical protein